MPIYSRSIRGTISAIAGTAFIIATSPTPAAAWSWTDPSSWFSNTYVPSTKAAPADPMVLISARQSLDGLDDDSKLFVSDAVAEFRYNGAKEDEVISFLDELDWRAGEALDGVSALTNVNLGGVKVGFDIAVLVAGALAAVIVAAGEQISQALRTTLTWAQTKIKPIPGTYIPPAPGDCPPDQHSDLQDRVDNSCQNSASCNSTMSKAILQQNISTHSQCIDARNRINNTCFRGGDSGHNQQIQNRVNGLRNCMDWLAR
jgi:Novel toxin 16